MDNHPYCLTLIETTGIQDYIFSTNNLGVNLGASELVERVTSAWLVEALPARHNLTLKEPEVEYGHGHIEDGELRAEVIYRGGGNALVLFDTPETARDCVYRLTARILQDAPGLQVVAAHLSFNWQADVLPARLQSLRARLAERKLNRFFSTPLPGLGVTAVCVFTGQPAAYYRRTNPKETRERYVSAEVNAKLNATEASNERLHRLLPLVSEKQYKFVYDFDQFGTHGESSYLAVFHADGNHLGKRIQRLLDPFNRPDQNREAVEKLRGFSISVQQAASHALQETVRLLITSRDESDRSWHRPDISASEAEIKVDTPYLDPAHRQQLLPFRPLVFGGDDMTFVTEGRLGLTLAQRYLMECQRQILSDGRPFYCRGGLAVVKTHYPFSRAYELAADLADNNKHDEEWKKDYPNLSGLDWHFATVGLVESPKTIRKNLERPAGKLYLRPLRLDQPAMEWRTWAKFTAVMRDFQDGPDWSGRRNKVKALREALCDGPQSVGQFLDYYSPQNRSLPVYDASLPDLHTTGWHSGRCGYFDPIEALDFFIPLEG